MGQKAIKQIKEIITFQTHGDGCFNLNFSNKSQVDVSKQQVTNENIDESPMTILLPIVYNF